MSISFSPTPALRVEIKPSPSFGAMLIIVVLAALAAIFYAQLSGLPRLLLVLVTLFYAGYCWHMQRRQRGILQFRSAWLWRAEDGGERALQLRHATVWPGLLVLSFRDIERRQKFVLTLFADSFADLRAGESARHLRVYLNHFPVFADDKNTG